MTHALIGGVPLLVMLVLALMIFSRKGPHPASYKLPEPWTHDPILWAATGEKVGDGHGHGHGSSGYAVGGGASGRW